MGMVETRAEEMGRRGRQVATQLYDWAKTIYPLVEEFQKGEDFSSIGRIPQDFKRTCKEIAGENAPLLFKLFSNITSKTRKIASEEGGGSIYRPYVYDQRDQNSNKVLGVKIERRGGLARLATIKLALPTRENALTLSVQNTRLPNSIPDLVFRATKDGVTLVRGEQETPEEEKWLDEPFERYVEEVLSEALSISPKIASPA